MPAKWTLTKTEFTTSEGGVETTSPGATIHLDVGTPEDPTTLDDITALIANLTTVRGIPGTARLTTTLDAVLAWDATPPA